MSSTFARLRNFARLSLSGKLSQDIAWNLGSFAILAVSGIVINFIIAAVWDADTLGVFNLVFAVYIVLSQVFSLGVHYSALRHAAHYAESPKQLGHIASSAAALGIATGMAAATAAYFGAPLAEILFSSARVADGLQWAAGGLLLFPLSKILLGLANGMRLMRFFALTQASRYLVILGWIFFVALTGMPSQTMLAAFLISEAVVLALCLAYLPWRGGIPFTQPTMEWIRKHLNFGMRGMFAGMFVELNSRVDVLVLGVFLSEHAVGVYSFAAMLVDGYYAVLAVIRNNLNPLLVRILRDQNQCELVRLLHNTRRMLYPIMLGFGLLLITGIAILVYFFLPDKDLNKSISILAILLSGIWLCAAFIPLDNILMQSGQPGWQTIQHSVLVATNLILNLLFIPILGVYGAALGTTLAYMAGTMMLIILARYRLNIDMLSGRFTSPSTHR